MDGKALSMVSMNKISIRFFRDIARMEAEKVCGCMDVCQILISEMEVFCLRA